MAAAPSKSKVNNVTKETDYLTRRLGAFPSPWDNLRYRVPSPTPTQLAEIPEEYSGLEKYQVIGDQGLSLIHI